MRSLQTEHRDRVRESQDLSPKRDLATRQSVRVATTIPPLMLMTHERGERPQSGGKPISLPI